MAKKRGGSVLSVLGLFISLFGGVNFILQPNLELTAIRLPDRKTQLPMPILVVGMPKGMSTTSTVGSSTLSFSHPLFHHAVGTSSIYEFFKCNGIKSSHYCCCGSNRTHTHCGDGRSFAVCMRQNIKQNRRILEGCGDYDVYAQMDGEIGNSKWLWSMLAVSIHDEFESTHIKVTK